jgi:hypothetical protein
VSPRPQELPDTQYRGGDQADRDGQGAERRTEEHHTSIYAVGIPFVT